MQHDNIIRPLTLCLAAVLLLGSLSWSADERPAAAVRVPTDERLTPTVRAVAQSYPAVVSIGTENLVRVNDGYDTFFHEFYGRIKRLRSKVVKSYTPLGSGIILCADGVVLTNLHVVRRADNLEIRLWDGSSRSAEIVGFDAPSDLAVLRVLPKDNATPLTEATLGQPDDVFLGETVITIGNPFGLDHSVSQGVLSALNRSYGDDDSPYADILQTDAAINPGNSGGPLINLKGEVIGINQAIRRDASGIGFAIPAKRIEDYAARWLLPCRFSNAYLGIDPNSGFLPGKQGVRIARLLPDSPAAKAGLDTEAEIVSLNGHPVRRPLDLGRQIWNLHAGDTVNVTLADGRTLTFAAADMPDDVLIETRLGLHVQSLTAELCDAVDLPHDWRGLVINAIAPEQDFLNQQTEWRKTLKRGDILMKAGNQPVQSEKELAAILRKSRCGQEIPLHALVYDHSQGRLVLVRFSAQLQ